MSWALSTSSSAFSRLASASFNFASASLTFASAALILAALDGSSFEIAFASFSSVSAAVTSAFAVDTLFSASVFLATVSVIDNKTAMLRINPTNGVYHFAPGIVTKIFEYVEFKLAS